MQDYACTCVMYRLYNTKMHYKTLCMARLSNARSCMQIYKHCDSIPFLRGTGCSDRWRGPIRDLHPLNWIFNRFPPTVAETVAGKVAKSIDTKLYFESCKIKLNLDCNYIFRRDSPPKWNSLWQQINRKRVFTLQIWFDLTRQTMT